MKNRDKKFLMAAVAGISMGLGLSGASIADEKKDEVKCWGINGCGSHAKCSVTGEDLKAIRALVGEKEYAKLYAKSEPHGCGSHAKCGASSQILNWVPSSADECKAQGGFVVDEVGAPKKKVARKA